MEELVLDSGDGGGLWPGGREEAAVEVRRRDSGVSLKAGDRVEAEGREEREEVMEGREAAGSKEEETISPGGVEAAPVAVAASSEVAATLAAASTASIASVRLALKKFSEIEMSGSGLEPCPSG